MLTCTKHCGGFCRISLVQRASVRRSAALIDVIAPYYPEGKNGRPPFALEC